MIVRYLPNTELYHHGIKGQKWGVRRYQNADGSLTAAGQKRYNKIEARAKKDSEMMSRFYAEGVANQEHNFNKILGDIEQNMKNYREGTARYDEHLAKYKHVKATGETTKFVMKNYNDNIQKGISAISDMKKLKLTDPQAARAIAKSKDFKTLIEPYKKAYLNVYNGGSYATTAVYAEMQPNLERYQQYYDEIYKQIK